MRARLFHRLNRARLRLGLFRSKNYAELYFDDETRCPFWEVRWRESLNEVGWDTKRQATHYIRRCVRRGVRP
jgi:hypothetical protein